jgi:hypothetical protein
MREEHIRNEIERKKLELARHRKELAVERAREFAKEKRDSIREAAKDKFERARDISESHSEPGHKGSGLFYLIMVIIIIAALWIFLQK